MNEQIEKLNERASMWTDAYNDAYDRLASSDEWGHKTIQQCQLSALAIADTLIDAYDRRFPSGWRLPKDLLEKRIDVSTGRLVSDEDPKTSFGRYNGGTDEEILNTIEDDDDEIEEDEEDKDEVAIHVNKEDLMAIIEPFLFEPINAELIEGIRLALLDFIDDQIDIHVLPAGVRMNIFDAEVILGDDKS